LSRYLAEQNQSIFHMDTGRRSGFDKDIWWFPAFGGPDMMKCAVVFVCAGSGRPILSRRLQSLCVASIIQEQDIQKVLNISYCNIAIAER
jgi:hypothetical protein